MKRCHVCKKIITKHTKYIELPKLKYAHKNCMENYLNNKGVDG